MGYLLFGSRTFSSTKIARAISTGVVGFALLWGQPSFAFNCFRFLAPRPSISLDKQRYVDLLAGTSEWQSSARALQAATSVNLKQPFQMRVNSGSDSRLRPPVETQKYASAKFVVGKSPGHVPPGAKVIGHADFGYHVASEYRRLGSVNYFVVSETGEVLEVGGGTPEVLTEFKANLLGRKLSAEELHRISDLNKKLISDLRSKPELQAKVAQFAADRGWPEGLADRAGLAYFSEDFVPLRQWAKQNGYSLAEMRDAGWMKVSFDAQGGPCYSVNGRDSIKIPFFSDPDHQTLPLWRTRQMGNPDPLAPKYIGWPLNRSLDRRLTPEEKLYNGGALSGAKGKTVVITEGEFKTLVAEQASGKITVGLPGITEWDHNMIRGLVESGAKEFIVVLDRDARAKGLARADGVNDSQRAAYAIGKALEAAGAKSVRVGLLPDVFDGGKVGIDDLVLAKGNRPYAKVLKDARSPDEYGKQIAIDPIFQDLTFRRQQLRKSLDAYENSRRRGGPEAPAEAVQTAKVQLSQLERAYQDYLQEHFNEARHLEQAAASESSLSRVTDIPNAADKRITVPSGQELPLRAFAGEVLVLDFTPSDLAPSLCKPVPCQALPYSSAQLRQAYAGKARLGVLRAEVEKGRALTKEVGVEASSLEDFGSLALSGQLAKSFPTDEYYFEFNVLLQRHSSTVAQVPVVIRRIKGGAVVAIAQLRLPTGEKLATDNEAFKRADQRLQSIVQYLRP